MFPTTWLCLHGRLIPVDTTRSWSVCRHCRAIAEGCSYSSGTQTSRKPLPEAMNSPRAPTCLRTTVHIDWLGVFFSVGISLESSLLLLLCRSLHLIVSGGFVPQKRGEAFEEWPSRRHRMPKHHRSSQKRPRSPGVWWGDELNERDGGVAEQVVERRTKHKQEARGSRPARERSRAREPSPKFQQDFK